MKKMLALFLICFSFSFGALYIIAGRFFGISPQSPVKIGNSKECVSHLMMGKHKVKLYQQHIVNKGNYYRYQHNSRKLVYTLGASGDIGVIPQIEFEIHFKRLAPFADKKLRLTKPNCIYYSKKSTEKMETPRRFEISARNGILVQGEKQFATLSLSGGVMVKGYDKKQRQVAVLKTEALRINFTNRTMSTERKIKFRQAKVIEIEGTGMRSNMNLDNLILLRDNTLTIMSGIWQATSQQKKSVYFEKITSRCDGSSKVHYDRDGSLLQISQHQNVRMDSDQAKLICGKIDFRMEKIANKWQMREFEAQDNVRFYDGAKEHRNFASGGHFRLRFSGKQGERIAKITIREQPKITIRDFGGFSLVEPQKRPRLVNRQQKLEVNRLDASCEDKLEWQRTPLSSGQRETFTFFKKVYLQEISQDAQKRTLTGERVYLIIESNNGAPRIPKLLDARGTPVILEYERGWTKGKRLRWQRLSDMESKATLSGKNPQIELKEVALGSESSFFQGASPLMKSTKVSPGERKKQQEKEDVRIDSRKPMELYILENPYGNSIYGCGMGGSITRESIHSGLALHYRAFDRVRIKRYRSGTNQKKGDIRCEKLSLKSISKKIAGKDEKNDIEKMEMEKLQASGRVRFTSPEISGGGHQLVVNGKKSASLEGKAWLENEDGKLSAKKFFYNSARGIFTASGKVRLKSANAQARGDTLHYYKTKDLLQLLGKPAMVKRLAKNGSQNSIKARQIRYRRDRGEVMAKKNVVLTMTSSEKTRQFLAEKFSDGSGQNGKDTTGKESKYRLVSQFLQAKINPQQKSISSFKARGGVYIEKLLVGDDKVESARGDRLEYQGQKGYLEGKPAEILYGDNQISGRRIRFDEEKQLAICENPERVILNSSGQNIELHNSNVASKEGNSSPVEIRCKNPIRFDRKNNEIEFSNQVEVKLKQGKLRCEILKVFLHKGEAAKMIAYRQVNFVSGEHSITGDRLEWDKNSDMAFATGYPYVKLTSSRFTMISPIVWYQIKSRRFFTRGKNISLEKFPER